MSLQILPVHGLPDIAPGDDLAAMILAAFPDLAPGDVVVVTQKIVSKAEGRLVRLEDVRPSHFAEEWAAAWGKDPRAVEVVLRASRRVVRMDRGVLITETHHGFICANAGVDVSNIKQGYVALLPDDPDATCAALRTRFEDAAGSPVGVVISDTFGRPWRDGLTNVAIGTAGLAALVSFKGQVDEFGNELHVTVMAMADEVAAAAELVQGKLDRVPVAIVRGLAWTPDDEAAARQYVRPAGMDLFR